MAKLIIDSGGTKMHLALIQDDGSVHEWERPGVNALTASEEELHELIDSELYPEMLDEAFFYGAGVATDEVFDKVQAALPIANISQVCTDLYGAARALFDDKPGVAVILGTGSNSCHYDGDSIVQDIPPLGYILGDEGSGASLGRALLRHIYRYNPPLREIFEQETGLTYEDVLDRVYRQPGANKFLASLVPFMVKHLKDQPVISHIVSDEIRRLKEAALDFYPEGLPIGFVGGVAKAFEDILRLDFPKAQILGRPMPRLIKFHSTHDISCLDEE